MMIVKYKNERRLKFIRKRSKLGFVIFCCDTIINRGRARATWQYHAIYFVIETTEEPNSTIRVAWCVPALALIAIRRHVTAVRRMCARIHIPSSISFPRSSPQKSSLKASFSSSSSLRSSPFFKSCPHKREVCLHT